MRKFKYLSISDIHLLHRVVKTPEMTGALFFFFALYQREIDDCDAIFIVGDLWDQLGEHPSEDMNFANIFVFWLYNYVTEHRKLLIVLEGTPSHDWRQSKIFADISKDRDDGLVRYVSTLSVEYIPQFDMHILCVPDEWREDTAETYSEVKTLMSKVGIDKVDITLLHGHFNFQIPAHLHNIQRHNESDYLAITKGYVHAGHDHTYAVHDRIIAQGSFGRLRHNEEEEKGAVVCEMSDEGVTHTFLPNTNTKIFKAIKIQSTTVRALRRELSLLKDLPKGSHVQLDARGVVIEHIKEIAELYPGIVFTFKKEKPSQVMKRDKLLYTIEDPRLTEANLKHQLLSDVSANSSFKYDELESIFDSIVME